MRSPSPVEPGAARSSTWSASGGTCSRSSSRLAPKPPVARMSGPPPSEGSTTGAPSRASPAAATSASVSPSGAKRSPVVSGLPVSRSTTGAPSDSSQRRSSSRRSKRTRWRRSSPPGQSARKRPKSRWRQITPLDSRIDPPAWSSFSSTSGRAPRRRASAAATRPAMPAPATVRSFKGSDQREAWLVLDVLDADARRPAQEHRERVRGVLDVVDLHPALLGLTLDLAGRVDQQRDVVEQRALAAVALALDDAQLAIGDREIAAAPLEAHGLQLGQGRVAIGQPQ